MPIRASTTASLLPSNKRIFRILQRTDDGPIFKLSDSKSGKGVNLTYHNLYIYDPKDDGALMDGGSQLTEGVDYSATVTRSTTTSGQYDITLTALPTSNYKGTVKTFTTQVSNTDETHAADLATMVQTLELTKATGSTDPATYEYDAMPHNEPGFVFKDKNGTDISLTRGTDYEYSITKKDTQVQVYDSAKTTNLGAIDQGEYIVEVRGKGNYSGRFTSEDKGQRFTITPCELTKNNIIVSVSPKILNYTGEQRFPDVTVTYCYGTDRKTKKVLTPNTDYVAVPSESGQAPIKPGTYAVEIKGQGNFQNNVDFANSTLARAKNTDETDEAYAQYLRENPDLAHPDSIYTYKIVSTLDSATIYLGDEGASADTLGNPTKKGDGWKSAYTATYDGKSHKPAVKVVVDDSELKAYSASDSTTTNTGKYKVIYPDNGNINAGEGTIRIKGLNEYADEPEIVVTFNIAPKSISGATFKKPADKTYGMSNGSVNLGTEGTNITLSKSEVEITDTDRDKKLTMSETEDGDGDFYLKYEGNDKATDAAKVTAVGINNYEGELSQTFTINPLEMSTANGFAVAPIDPQSFTGSPIKPAFKVTFKTSTYLNDTDYEVVEDSYQNNVKVSTDNTMAEFQVKGKGNFTGTLTGKFKILQKSLLSGTVTYKLGGKEGTLARISNSHYSVEYTGKIVKPKPTLKDGYYELVEGEDYTLAWNYDANYGEKLIQITGKGNYEGVSAFLKFSVTKKPFNQSTLKLTSISEADFGKMTAEEQKSVLTTGSEVKRYYQLKDGTENVNAPAKDSDGKVVASDYTYKWTKASDSSVTENASPSHAGNDYTLTLTGAGNYTGEVSITADSTGKPLAVGASLDVNEIVDAAEKSGSDPNVTVPFLGTNMPVVTVDASKLTSADRSTGDVHGYNTNVAFAFTKADNTVDTTAKLVGPAYSEGKYVNGQEGQDYTIEYVDENGNALTSLPVGTSFRIRISAVAGSSRFFGSHTILNARTVAACSLSDLAGRSNVTVSDDKATKAYEKDSSSAATSKLTYAFTGGTITPALKPEFVPQAESTYSTTTVFDSTTDAHGKTKDSFAPVDLATYGFTYDTKNPDNNQVLAAAVNGNGTITLTGDGANFTNSTDIYYEITSHPVEKSDIKLDTARLKYTYDGTSHKDGITGAVSVVSLGQTLEEGTDYTVEFHQKEDCSDTKINVDNPGTAFTDAGEIYVKITKGSNTSGNFTIPADGLIADAHFTIEKRDLSNVVVTPTHKVNNNTLVAIPSDKENVYAIPYTKVLTTSDISATVKDSDDAVTIASTDYDVKGPDALALGPNTITVTAKDSGNYKGSQTATFYICLKALMRLTALTPAPCWKMVRHLH